MMKMKWLILLLIAVSLSSCATKRQRAVHHLNRAIELDPQVLQTLNSPIRIDTQVIVKKEIIREKVVDSTGLYTQEDINSLIRELNKNAGDTLATLLENSKLKLELQKTKEGWLQFKSTIKPDTIHWKDTVRINIIKEVPITNQAPHIVKDRGYLYWSGLFAHILLVLFVLWKILSKR